jgi:DNA repair protein RecO (recombination protein O)
MPYWRSLALVLRVIDYSETSQIAALFTRDRGRISAIAKGAKRKGSRFVGELEPVTLVEAVCFRGRDPTSMHTLSELDVRETYRGVRHELRRLHAAAYVVEVLREIAQDEQPLPDVFDLATATLKRISAPGASFDAGAVPAFEARLLELLGLFPRIEACVECEAPGRGVFSARLGGVLCGDCRGHDRAARDISPGALQALEVLARTPERGAHLKLAPGQLGELRGLLNAYMAVALDRELKLSKYLSM